MLRNKSQSLQYSTSWWSFFGIPTQTSNESCYSMKNFVACKKCKTIYPYSRPTSSDKLRKYECYMEINKQQNATNSSSTSKCTLDAKLT